MNKIYLVILVSSVGFIGCNRPNTQIPENVLSAFSQKFTAATEIKWSRENEKEWEAEFRMQGKEYSANFDNSGTWMETEYAINEEEIPARVKTTLENEFPGYKIEASEISETDGGKMNEFELKKEGALIEVSIDLNGKVVKKEEIKAEDETEDD